ncbi:MAG: hypothetical protein NTX36_08550 [Proteobacteria bacterium]|nr:hypothetical protein [Pseudomonadota bacterium]
MGSPQCFSTIKETPELAEIRLIKQPRLAVMAISELEFNGIVDNAK